MATRWYYRNIERRTSRQKSQLKSTLQFRKYIVLQGFIVVGFDMKCAFLFAWGDAMQYEIVLNERTIKTVERLLSKNRDVILRSNNGEEVHLKPDRGRVKVFSTSMKLEYVQEQKEEKQWEDG